MIEQRKHEGEEGILGAKYDNNEHTFHTILPQDAPFSTEKYEKKKKS